jgi:hypothetical protein
MFIIRYFARDKYDALFDLAAPACAHVQVMEYPDLPFLQWSYDYDGSDQFSGEYRSSGIIDNRERYRRAFREIASYLEGYLERFPEYRDPSRPKTGRGNMYEGLHEALVAAGANANKVKNWQGLLVARGFLSKEDPCCAYDANRWLKEAFLDFDKKKFDQRKVEGAIPTADFTLSHWYRYYLAVKWYKERFFYHCAQAGLEIPR